MGTRDEDIADAEQRRARSLEASADARRRFIAATAECAAAELPGAVASAVARESDRLLTMDPEAVGALKADVEQYVADLPTQCAQILADPSLWFDMLDGDARSGLIDQIARPWSTRPKSSRSIEAAELAKAYRSCVDGVGDVLIQHGIWDDVVIGGRRVRVGLGLEPCEAVLAAAGDYLDAAYEYRDATRQLELATEERDRALARELWDNA